VVGTTIPALDANLGTVVGTTIPALDANLGTLFLGNVSTNANLGAYQTWANLSLAPLSQPTFVSNLIVDTGANFFVRHNTLSTFGGNVDVGSSDGAAANLIVRNGSTATFSSNIEVGTVDGVAANIIVRNGSSLTVANLEIGGVEGSVGNLIVRNGSHATISNLEIGDSGGVASNLIVRNGSHATFTTNVTMVPGGNVHVPEGVEFSIYGANVAVYKSTRIAAYPWPSVSTGAAGDRAGMIAFDTNTNTLLICVANYDGTSHIWANIAGPAGPGLPSW
jgi:hypothetical protein